MKILRAFIKKEFLQIVRDPSSILIAFILPTLLSLIYMYGINMDSVNISLGLKLDDANPRVTTLARSFSNNRYLQTQIYDSRDAMYSDIVNSKLQGAVVVPNDFTVNLNNGRRRSWSLLTAVKPTRPIMSSSTPAALLPNGWQRWGTPASSQA